MMPAYRGLGVMWCEYTPAREESPKPRKLPATGDSRPKAALADSAQDIKLSAVRTTPPAPPPASSDHEAESGGHSPNLPNVVPAANATADAETGSRIGEDKAPASGEGETVTSAVTDEMEVASDVADDKENSDRAARRALTDGEVARAMVYVECGMSLRAAAAEIGRHHTTLLKRIKSDRAVRDAYAAAKEKARSAPLAQVREASKTSWRAAAWLVKYLDAREQGGRPPARLANLNRASGGEAPRESGRRDEPVEREEDETMEESSFQILDRTT